MKHITHVLINYLTDDFGRNVNILLKLIDELRNQGVTSGEVEFLFLPDFIETYGLEEYEASVKSFESITQFVSCEFAVRPFILKYESFMIHLMFNWSNHPNPEVRRLASEGCRPRLPWAMALPSLKKNPDPIILILENLKNDESESVRRSVANNLNDISKDNPEVVIEIARKWKGESKETDKIIKHACRTLLKQGVPEVMQLFGFGHIEHIRITDFKIHTYSVKIGSDLRFSLSLTNTDNATSKLRLEYGLYYQKANGSLSKKVFLIGEKKYPKQSTTKIIRKQPFKIITTRKFYAGKHNLSIIINGTEIEKIDFELLV
ncbi:DNA alkylation repair protein [Ulvibacter sp. MAR_2010_11]|uniref:DNA alkylation repair protein n=1 Tax=Ulvibacter sp. MAR_2010_11 TaxID=1250229 RepID=UPI001E640389|nr:DNA alkylation repair protein [Ulvibacter sp. MAR_2010_11]